MTPRTHPGIEVAGDLTNGVRVTINGRERIRAVRDSAARHRLDPRDVDLGMLQDAVHLGLDQVTLDPVDDEEDATDLAGLLSDVRNGDDPSPGMAARYLLAIPRRMVVCPECDGEGEIEEPRKRVSA